MFEGFRQFDIQSNLVRSVALSCGQYPAEQAPELIFKLPYYKK
jgi:hypothetical protein